jgi:phospholipid/cholesterol/gamma-HCH transport system substrate-binding protein
MTRRLRAAVMPLLVVAGTFAVFLGGKRLLFEHPGGYIVEARFADSAGLRKNSAVKIGGVPGGRVMGITLAPDDTALVRMRLDPAAAPIGPDAAARSRPVNLLGEKYVDLDVGDQRRGQPSGTTIPVARTGASVELDDVLNVLAPDVRARLRILTNEAGIALAGRGADFNGLLERFPAALDQLDGTISDLGADTARMERLIVQSSRVVGAVDRRRDDLGRLVAGAAGALDAAASRRHALGETVDRAPQTLGQLRASVTQLGVTATRLTPAARQLRATAPALRRTLALAPAFTADAAPTLRTAQSVAPDLTRLGRDGTAPARHLGPLADSLAQFAARLAPVSSTVDGAMDDALGFIHGYARAEQQRDGLGHTLRLREIVGKDALEALIDRYVKAPAARRRPGTAKPAPAGGGSAKPPAPAPAKPPLSRPADVLPAVGDAVKDAVGKTAGGVGALLDFLLAP